MSLGERLGKRVLAIYPNSRGFGYVMFEDPKTLSAWGLPRVAPADEPEILSRISKLLERHRPAVLVIESTADPKCRRQDRVRGLLETIRGLAPRTGVPVEAVSKAAIARAFARTPAGTKHEIASVIASQHPELAPRLPPPRKEWESETARMSLFSAAALAIAFYLDQT